MPTMRKPEALNKQQDTMQNYFSALLREESPVVTERVVEQPLNRLLDKVSEYQQQSQAPQEEIQIQVSEAIDASNEQISLDANQPYSEDFQALIFDVAGLKLAVRLEELGGIHRLDVKQIKSIPGKPNWFKGLIAHREQQLRVIDSGLWIMPEKYTEQLEDKDNYQYLIMLKESPWGLACHRLSSTCTIPVDGVRWRKTAGKRPWLKGMVIDQMCTLLNVEQMIELFDNGLGS